MKCHRLWRWSSAQSWARTFAETIGFLLCASEGFVVAVAQSALPQAVPAQVPAHCVEFATCSSATGANWELFRQTLRKAVAEEAANPQAAMELYFHLMETYALDAGLALECRIGVATVFFRLGRQYLQLGFAQRAANLFQLAMSMFWDASRAENGLDCLQLELWGVRWFDEFMEVYLSHAAALRRNSVAMLPYPTHWQVPSDYRDTSLRIGIYSLCEYGPSSPMHWLLTRSQQNREAYTQRHGYGMEWARERVPSARSRHPVWGQLAGPMELLDKKSSSREYDWVLSMDCDSLFVNMDVTIDSILYRFAARDTPWGRLELDPDVHFLISEDGRGLAGGNWIVRNSDAGRTFLKEVYGSEDPATNPFLKHSLRDQFSLLWHLVRPGVSKPLPSEEQVQAGAPLSPPKSWTDVGYLSGVRLVPQELLLGSYPFVSCSQPSDSAHRCFEAAGEAVPGGAAALATDFIVSLPLLGDLPQNMAQAQIDRFLLEGLGSFGAESRLYEQQLRSMCPSVDISRCLADPANNGISAR